MKRANVIVIAALIGIMGLGGSAAADQSLKQQFDSLFTLASSGAIIYQDLVEPAKDSIAALGVPAVPLLIDKFSTSSARERWAVIHILARIGSPAVPLLTEALQRPDEKIVQRVCWALGDIKDPAAIGPLTAIRNHASWQVRDQVCGALGKIGQAEPVATETVVAALADSIGEVRKAAAVSCGKLLVQEAVEPLVGMLGDDFYGARFSAFDALLKLDSVRVVEVLTDSITGATLLQGNVACDLLARIKTDRALELLFEQTFSLDPSRRAHAAVALIRGDPEDLCGFYEFLYERELDRLTLLKMQSAHRAASHDSQ